MGGHQCRSLPPFDSAQGALSLPASAGESDGLNGHEPSFNLLLLSLLLGKHGGLSGGEAS